MTTSQYSLPLCAFSPTGESPKAAEVLHEGKHSAEVYADACIRFLEEQATNNQPFFAYVAFQTPHDPRQCPPEFRAMYKDEEMKLPGSFLPRHAFDNGMLEIRDKQYKLIEYCVGKERHTQLFDLAKDPQETHNPAAEESCADTLAHLRKLLQEDRVRLNDGNSSSKVARQQGMDFWSAYDSPASDKQ